MNTLNLITRDDLLNERKRQIIEEGKKRKLNGIETFKNIKIGDYFCNPIGSLYDFYIVVNKKGSTTVELKELGRKFVRYGDYPESYVKIEPSEISEEIVKARVSGKELLLSNKMAFKVLRAVSDIEEEFLIDRYS